LQQAVESTQNRGSLIKISRIIPEKKAKMQDVIPQFLLPSSGGRDTIPKSKGQPSGLPSPNLSTIGSVDYQMKPAEEEVRGGKF
jgi:hypothetical protein